MHIKNIKEDISCNTGIYVPRYAISLVKENHIMVDSVKY